MKGKSVEFVWEHGYEMLYCDRCGENIQRDKFGIFIQEAAEVVDADGNVLIIHQACMKDTDKLA